MNFYSEVKIDSTVRVYGREDLLKIGKGSRIDAYCVITVGDEGVEIGSHVHVGAGAMIFGSGGKVRIGRYCSISPGAKLFTATDEMSSDGLIGACAPEGHRVPLVRGDIVMDDMSAVGAGSILFPPCVLGVGSVVGAMSIARKEVFPWSVVVGLDKPRVIGHRKIVEVPNDA